MFRSTTSRAGQVHTTGVGLMGVVVWLVLGIGCAPQGASRPRMITIQPGDGVQVPPALRRHMDALRPCYRAALNKRKGLSGELELRLIFHDTGKLKTFSSSTELPEALMGCVRDRIAAWEIRPQAAERAIGPVTVSFQPVREPVRPAPRARLRGVVVWPESLPKPKAGDSVGGKIDRIVRERVASLRYCYNRALIHSPKLRAAARIWFSINRYGRPYKIRVRPAAPGMLSQQMTSCLRRQLVEWHFFRLPIDLRYGPMVIKFDRRR